LLRAIAGLAMDFSQIYLLPLVNRGEPLIPSKSKYLVQDRVFMEDQCRQRICEAAAVDS